MKQIIDKIQKLKKTSICPIAIPNDLIQAFPDKLCIPLAIIFNDISNSRCYWLCWTLGYVIQIRKKGGMNDFTGVRLITLAPVFQKCTRVLIANWLKAKILELIDLQQFGNLKETSTSHYLVSLLDTILKNE